MGITTPGGIGKAQLHLFQETTNGKESVLRAAFGIDTRAPQRASGSGWHRYYTTGRETKCGRSLYIHLYLVMMIILKHSRENGF